MVLASRECFRRNDAYQRWDGYLETALVGCERNPNSAQLSAQRRGCSGFAIGAEVPALALQSCPLPPTDENQAQYRLVGGIDDFQRCSV